MGGDGTLTSRVWSFQANVSLCQFLAEGRLLESALSRRRLTFLIVR